ncbi:MAG: biphenyl 2,3-dioxygenase [Acetobacteraceae bacterium]|nr:biphenyl 2,3-dioxygenase [Acetobacteraceae bacterium]
MTRRPRDPVKPEAVSPALFAHFVVRTSNFEGMRHWYQTVLNARIVHDNGTLCFMTYDDEHHRLALVNVPGLKKPEADSWGLNHLAYSYNSLRDLLSTYVRLRDQGIVPFRPINHGPTVSMYYHDPDGTGVELQVDTFATKQEAEAWFGRDEFKENPIGVLFDPEDLLRDFEAGVPEVDLLTRPEGGAAPSLAARK